MKTTLKNQILEVLGIKSFVFSQINIAEGEHQGKMLSTPAEKFDVGVDVTIMDEAGAEMPAPDGEYVIDSGEVVVVAEGKVTEIKVKEEAPAEDAPVEAKTEEPAKEEVKAEEVKAEVMDEAKIGQMIMAAVTPLVDKIAELEAKIIAMEGGAAEMSKSIEKFSKAPAASPVKKTEAQETKARQYANIEKISQLLSKNA